MALVGEQLRRAREALDYSIPDVVGMTNLMTDQVLALEEGDWMAFAAPVYVRGFVRSYAGVLKLDAETLLADLDEEMGQGNREHGGLSGDAQLRSGFVDGFIDDNAANGEPAVWRVGDEIRSATVHVVLPHFRSFNLFA